MIKSYCYGGVYLGQFSKSWLITLEDFNVLLIALISFSFSAVLGAIAWTLQPLWPESTRVSLWYLAVGAGLLIAVLIALIISK